MPQDVQTCAARVANAAGPEDAPEPAGRAVVPDVLPPVPVEVRDDDAAFVVERLVADLGGRAVRG